MSLRKPRAIDRLGRVLRWKLSDRGCQMDKSDHKSNKVKFSKMVIISVLIAVLVFTVAMIVIFLVTEDHTVPDTLITYFFLFCSGEAGCLGLIKYGDTKYDKPDSPDDGNH